MAKYIKANHKVAQYLHLQGIRLKLIDGNYMLWQADMLHFGKLSNIKEIAAKIGALVLTPEEARQEQDGIKLRELPTAEDERFV